MRGVHHQSGAKRQTGTFPRDLTLLLEAGLEREPGRKAAAQRESGPRKCERPKWVIFTATEVSHADQ